MLGDVREGRDHLTTWLQTEIEKALLVHWDTDEGFRHQRLTNRANRASARSSKYMSKSLDREVTLAKTFKYTHALKENKARFAY
ncbi:hypothetical protein Ahy_A10g048786 [Arachis hypogaea]|uniref:Uncharacterized protein n=1 Tax=Arachis hypogaea TaxID=3818 RepID=A0A445B5W6_ARAHY|nr:hypothetical protein Ahy_A10g048786 [Arachis hypogaea]